MKHLIFIIFFFMMCSYVLSQETGTLVDKEDGRSYKIVKIGTQWWMAENLNYASPEGSFCYNNIDSNCLKYGRLYTWDVAMRVCPRGWHLPSKTEFEQLIEYVEGIDNMTVSSYIQLIEGGKTGFNVVLSGRYRNNFFENLDINAYFWSSSKDYLENKWYLNMLSQNKNAFFYFGKSNEALSVRCIKN